MTEFANEGPVPQPVTSFAYDWRPGRRVHGQVTDSRGNATTYTMNARGNSTLIQEPLGEADDRLWPPDDILKMERDGRRGPPDRVRLRRERAT